MEYSCSFIFNKSLTKVLLEMKNLNKDKNQYNGIGRKLNLGETALSCAVHALKEEADLEFEQDTLSSLVTVVYAGDLKLHIFYGVLDDVRKIKKTSQDGVKLSWFSVRNIQGAFIDNELLAGKGNVIWFVNEAFSKLNKQKLGSTYAE